MKIKDSKIGKWLQTSAPDVLDTIGGVLPFPFSAGIKIVKSLVQKHPDLSVQAKDEFMKLALEFEQTEMKLMNEDRANARDLQKAALSQDDSFSKRFVYYLAGFSVVTGFIYIFCATWIEIPKENQRLADVMTGILTTVIFGSIFQYFFGSTKSSHDKTKMLAQKGE